MTDLNLYLLQYAFLKSLRHISEADIINVRMPVVQVMGLEAKVPCLRLIGKKKYAMEDLHSFKFPQTAARLKSGELESLINGLALIEVNASARVFNPLFIYLLFKDMVNSLESKFNDGQNDKDSSMDRILKETNKEKEKGNNSEVMVVQCNLG